MEKLERRQLNETAAIDWQSYWASAVPGKKSNDARRSRRRREPMPRKNERLLMLELLAPMTAGQRLRDDAASLAATVSCPGTDTGSIARGQAATRAAMVLSELLARADARTGELAKAYDCARIAGLACETSYTALVKPPG